jgi:hypothetical protein
MMSLAEQVLFKLSETPVNFHGKWLLSSVLTKNQ